MNQSRLQWLLVISVMLILAVVLMRRRDGEPRTSSDTALSTITTGSSSASGERTKSIPAWPRQRATPTPASSAEEVVAAKLKRFAQSRREIMRAMARMKGVTVPVAVEQFFDAVETGDWAQIKAAFDAINGGE